MDRFRELVTLQVPEDVLTKHEDTEYPGFRKYHYFSRTAERETPVNVLLPQSYDGVKKFPVLYILHGYWDSEDWMARDVVKIDTMLPNLVKKGEAEEMIVVLPYIFCDREIPACTGMNLQNSLAYDNFINDLLTDLMPFIEKNFAVKTGPENTALTGFSMGGRESLFIGFSHPELFGYLGAVDPAPGLINVPTSPNHPGQLPKEAIRFDRIAPKVVFVGAARDCPADSDDPTNYRALMTQNGVEHIWQHMPNHPHDPTIVKPHLYNFFRMAFRA